MYADIDQALSVPTLRFEVELEPAQGTRFQPTNFPDLGPATYSRPDGTEMLLVESPQSMANRLEEVCWNHERADLHDVLTGLPYVRINLGNGLFTNSILEAHRLNSPYILESSDKTFMTALIQEFKEFEMSPVDVRKVARVVFKYDPNSVLHGVFFAKSDLAGGRIRLTRALSSFIEAEGVNVAESGGVKMDVVNPRGDTSKGFGHVPFHRTEFTASRITAYFSLDNALIKGYSLGETAEKLLCALALWKVRKFLDSGLRLRTNCDFQVKDREKIEIPELRYLEEILPGLIKKCAEEGLFAMPPVTEVQWKQ